MASKHTGAPLVSTDTGEIISIQQIHNAVRTRNHNLVSKDLATGLLYPGSATRIRTILKTEPVPPNHVIDPSSGYLVAVEGNVFYNAVCMELVFTCCNKNHQRDLQYEQDSLIPYISYPVDTETGQPIEIKIDPVARKSDLRLGSPMKDPDTGLIVPICAVTIHPKNHTVLPIGGVHTDPVTKLPVAIQLSSMFLDPITNTPAPILGVSIDPSTGSVIPVGGSLAVNNDGSTSNNRKTLLLGEKFSEPLSGLPVQLTSACFNFQDGTLRQCSGGFKTYLDSNELTQEKVCLDGLSQLLDLTKAQIIGEEDQHLITRETAKIEDSYKYLLLLFDANQSNWLKIFHDLTKNNEDCKSLSVAGGSPGYMEFKPTGQLLPLLLGESIPDESEGVTVPILGYEVDPISGEVKPLGGLMEIGDGRGRIPITIGEKAYDTSSGELATIIGAILNPDTGVVVPKLQNFFAATQPKKESVPSNVVC